MDDKVITEKVWNKKGELYRECTYFYNKPVSVKHIIDNIDRNNIMPPAGEIIVWKACYAKDIPVYVKLLVGKDDKRVTPKHCHKGRVSGATVLDIVDKDGKTYDECESFVYSCKSLKYVKGQRVIPDKFDDSEDESCGTGIHVHMYQDQCDEYF